MASTMSRVAISAPVLRDGQGLAPSSSRTAALRTQSVIVKPTAQRVVVAQAQKEESPVVNVSRTLLAGLAAVSIAVSGVDVAHAGTTGFGTGGVDVKKEAASLLENADRLTNEDSPPRFGPGRGEPASQGGRASQRAGSGAESNKAAGLTTPKSQVASTTDGGKFRVGKGVKYNKDILGRNIEAFGDALGKVQDAGSKAVNKAKNLVGEVPNVPDVKSAGKKAVNNIKAQISAKPDPSLLSKNGVNLPSAGNVKSKVESDIDQVKSQGKGLFASTPNLASPEKIKNQVESVGDKVKGGAKELVGKAPGASVTDKVQANLESAGDKIKGVVKGAVGAAPNLPSAGKVQTKVESDIDQVKSQGKGLFSQAPDVEGKVKSDISTTKSKVSSDIDTVKDKIENAFN